MDLFGIVHITLCNDKLLARNNRWTSDSVSKQY